MSDDLLVHYNRELSYIRKLGAEFAEAYPRIAGRLRLGPERSDDPHVERMIESFAYLNARIRSKLDDDFPELTDALLGIVYPHYLRPIPSMSIVQFLLDRAQGDLSTGYTIEKGAMIETEPIQGEPCRFRSCYPVTLWPVEVASAELKEAPFSAPKTGQSARALAMLRLDLACFSKESAFHQFDVRSLRFFLDGQASHVFPLYEYLLNNTVEIAVVNAASDREPLLLPASSLRGVGFGRDEGMLPYPPRSFEGYRLLSEFFTFPDKYLFVDLAGLDQGMLRGMGNRIEVYFFLNKITSDVARSVSKETFRLGCTPIVNLYQQRAEPITVTHAQTEYRVVPDARRPLAHEIYSVDRVGMITREGNEVPFHPFYSFKHASRSNEQRRFYSESRRQADTRTGATRGDHGSEVHLTLVDLEFRPTSPGDGTLVVETTCLNRDLPRRIPFGGDQPRLRLAKGGAPLSRIACLRAPTPTFRPPLKKGAMWRLISHLSLNHLSLVEDGERGPDALQEVLKLYDFADSPETRSMIEGIVGLRTRRVVGPAGRDMPGSFCRGIEVSLELDEDRFAGAGAFLFASVLERFFGLYSSINSFSRLHVTTRQRKEELRRWPPRAGERVLL